MSGSVFLNVLRSIVNWYYKMYVVTFMPYHAVRQRERETGAGKCLLQAPLQL